MNLRTRSLALIAGYGLLGPFALVLLDIIVSGSAPTPFDWGLWGWLLFPLSALPFGMPSFGEVVILALINGALVFATGWMMVALIEAAYEIPHRVIRFIRSR
jgi:hypothetical protein